MTESSLSGRAPDALVYKICPDTEWRQAQASGNHEGSPDDRRDDYIHLSTMQQLEGTLARHFAGQEGLVLIGFVAKQLGTDLRWEPSRGGELFPHLHGPLPVAAAIGVWPLSRGPDGRHLLPRMARREGKDG